MEPIDRLKLLSGQMDLEPAEDQPADEWTKFSRQLGRKFAHLFLHGDKAPEFARIEIVHVASAQIIDVLTGD